MRVSQICTALFVQIQYGDEGVALIYVPNGTRGMTFGKDEKRAGMAGVQKSPRVLNVRVQSGGQQDREWCGTAP